MSQIRGRDTGPELTIRRALWQLGYRYRLHSPVRGKPDIVFPRERIVIFIDGCFWHRCPLHYQAPAANAHMWEKKISGNVARDRAVDRQLADEGWKVLRIWEHEVENQPVKVVRQITRVIETVRRRSAIR